MRTGTKNEQGMNYGQVVQTIESLPGSICQREQKEREATSVLRPSLDPFLIVCFRSCYHRDCAPGRRKTAHLCEVDPGTTEGERCSPTEGKILRL